MQQINY